MQLLTRNHEKDTHMCKSKYKLYGTSFARYRKVHVEMRISHPLVSYSCISKYVRCCWILTLNRNNYRTEINLRTSVSGRDNSSSIYEPFFNLFMYLCTSTHAWIVFSNAVHICLWWGEITSEVLFILSLVLIRTAQY